MAICTCAPWEAQRMLLMTASSCMIVILRALQIGKYPLASGRCSLSYVLPGRCRLVFFDMDLFLSDLVYQAAARPSPCSNVLAEQRLHIRDIATVLM